MTDRDLNTQMAGPDDKTTVLPETAVALVEMERLQQELVASEERSKNHWEQYLRALADVDNVRKRAAKDLESTRQFAVEKFAQDLVAVKDSLELGIATLQKEGGGKPDVAGLIEGQNATLRLLAKATDSASAKIDNAIGWKQLITKMKSRFSVTRLRIETDEPMAAKMITDATIATAHGRTGPTITKPVSTTAAIEAT